MKISGIHRPTVDTGQSARRVQSRSTSTTDSKVAVSREAKQLAEARAPAVSDAGKVARLTAAIARGDFMVDANRIAEKIIDEES